MARSRNRFGPKPAFAKAPSEHDPLSWLYLNPKMEGFEPEPGFTYGVLRRAFAGRSNSAVEFCRRKAQPVAPPGDATAMPWAITAERIEVLLPQDADDRFLDPQILCEEVDRRAVEGEQALLSYVSMAFPTARRLHECWESARAFARASLVRKRGLAVILILHAPHRAGSGNDAHCHLLIVPRRLDGLGLRGFEPDLCRDSGQAAIHAAWLEHKAGWDT